VSESTVYVVDDEPDIRELLREIFATAGLKVKTFASASEFLPTYSPDNHGCLLLDMNMPDMDGLELLQALDGLGNQTPVIFLTGAGTVGNAVDALKAGAMDFIEKPVVMANLLSCIRRGLDLDLKRRYERLEAMQINQRFEQLTARESEVMSWIVEGKANKMIARLLGISSRTVEIHRRNIIAKMQASSIADLVKMDLAIRK
tara:strand:- start:98010 stop:98615 length:606 start_codon:yes stop_codon:yes gene_type:complete